MMHGQPHIKSTVSHYINTHPSMLFQLNFTVYKIPPSFSVLYFYCRKLNPNFPSPHFNLTTDVSNVFLPSSRFNAIWLPFQLPSISQIPLRTTLPTLLSSTQFPFSSIKLDNFLPYVFYIILPSLSRRLVSVCQRPAFTHPS